MPALDEQLRNFIDAGAVPVTAAEAMERAHAPGPSAESSQPIGRAPRKTKPAVAVLLVAAAVVLLVVFLVPGGGPTVTEGASAATVLRNAATIAENQKPLVPCPGQFLYVRLLVGSRATAPTFAPNGPPRPIARIYVSAIEQLWTSPSGPDAMTTETVGQPQFITKWDRSQWEAGGSLPVETGFSGGPAPPYYDVTDLPTDPSKMTAYFASQSYIEAPPPYGRNTIWEFSTASQFLLYGASAAQRAALLEFIATLPGVKSRGTGITLGTKETGVILSMPNDVPGFSAEDIIDPETSQLLEVRSVVTDPSKLVQFTPSQIANAQEIAQLQMGQAKAYEDSVYAGVSDSNSTSPKDAPPTPPPWPYGTSEPPVPGSAYP